MPASHWRVGLRGGRRPEKASGEETAGEFAPTRNYASPASDDPLTAIRTLIEGVRFAADSALEQAGFEPSVPLATRD